MPTDETTAPTATNAPPTLVDELRATDTRLDRIGRRLSAPVLRVLPDGWEYRQTVLPTSWGRPLRVEVYLQDGDWSACIRIDGDSVLVHRWSSGTGHEDITTDAIRLGVLRVLAGAA